MTSVRQKAHPAEQDRYRPTLLLHPLESCHPCHPPTLHGCKFNLQPDPHPHLPRRRLHEPVLPVQTAARRVGEQVDVCARRRLTFYPLHQSRHDQVAETLALVRGQHGDVDDVEVPASVALLDATPQSWSARNHSLGSRTCADKVQYVGHEE